MTGRRPLKTPAIVRALFPPDDVPPAAGEQECACMWEWLRVHGPRACDAACCCVLPTRVWVLSLPGSAAR